MAIEFAKLCKFGNIFILSCFPLKGLKHEIFELWFFHKSIGTSTSPNIFENVFVLAEIFTKIFTTSGEHYPEVAKMVLR